MLPYRFSTSKKEAPPEASPEAGTQDSRPDISSAGASNRVMVGRKSRKR